MNKTLFYIAVILNIIMFVVFLCVITVGISDELASGMVEKIRYLFNFNIWCLVTFYKHVFFVQGKCEI